MFIPVLAIAVAILLAGCGNTTTGGPSKTPALSPTPFVATDSHFSAVFPATPTRQTQNINQPGLNTTMTLYLATTNDEQVAVAFEQLPAAPQGAAVQTGLEAGVAGSATNTKGQVLSKSPTQFVGQPAEDAVIQTPGAVIHERLVFIGSKLYVLEGITRTTESKHPAYDTMLATFKTI